MKILFLVITIILFVSCQTKSSSKEHTISPQGDPCDNLKDSSKSIVIFSNADTILPTKDFYEIVKYIESKGNMQLQIGKHVPPKIRSKRDISLIHIVDTCKNDYFIGLGIISAKLF